MAYTRRRQTPRRRSPRLVSTPDGDESSTTPPPVLGEGGGSGGGGAFSDEWLWFSDLCCGAVTSQEVAEAEPYICFYERT